MQNSYSSEKERCQYAGFWVRVSAYVIDQMIIFLGLLLVRVILFIVGLFLVKGTMDDNFLFSYSIKDIILYICTASYFVCFTYYTGTTIGKKLMHLKVINKAEEKPLTFFTVVYRETIGRFLSGIIMNIGYMMIGIDQEKCGLHDILCDTRVIYDMKKKEKREIKTSEEVPSITISPTILEQEKLEDETNCDDDFT